MDDPAFMFITILIIGFIGYYILVLHKPIHN